MEQLLNQVRVAYSDPEVNEILKAPPHRDAPFSRHFSQGEDFFLRFEDPYEVPSFPIHHNFDADRPTPVYLGALRSFVDRIYQRAPGLLHDLTYMFDPSEIFRPTFFHLYRVQERMYMYVVRLDMSYKPQIHEAVTRTGNDHTPQYRTNLLFLEVDFVPLEDVNVVDGKVRALNVRQSISQTWIGETGRGYFVQGIWLDRELTKFFSKLFIPKGKRLYPYYPFTCKYKAICHSVVDLGPDGRKRALPRLHKASQFLEPRMPRIEAALKANQFSEDLEAFQSIKADVAESWNNAWDEVNVEVYLNDQDMREYRLS